LRSRSSTNSLTPTQTAPTTLTPNAHFCMNCGTKLPKGAGFCGSCGSQQP
jgi:predicted amidophosphoribosyltransferase